MPDKKQGDCIARIVPDSSQDIFLKTLRAIHEKKGEYSFIPWDEISDALPAATRQIVMDFENGIIDGMLRDRIVEKATDEDLFFKIHADHQIPFSKLGLDPWINLSRAFF